jgi:GNAT superfamily N-acetyltransferase
VGDITVEASRAVEAIELDAFFEGWPTPPSRTRRLEILLAADELVLARDDNRQLVGFITAITDRTFAAYIPLLEVIPAWRRRGVGSRLVNCMLSRLSQCYMIDLVCDDDVVPFYERLGGTRLSAIVWRHHQQLDPHV